LIASALFALPALIALDVINELKAKHKKTQARISLDLKNTKKPLKVFSSQEH